MRCLEEMLMQELAEDDALELFEMDTSDIDIFMTNEEYSAAENNCFNTTRDVKADHHRYYTDDDNSPDDHINLDPNSIISYYSGSSELDALVSSDINSTYGAHAGEEKYDG